MSRGRKGSRSHLEDQEQKALIQWAELCPHPYLPGTILDYLIAIPNGAHMASPGHAKKLKDMGMKPGVSDLLLCCPAGGCGGLWIELKRPRETFDYPGGIKRAQRAEQQDWIGKMKRVGYAGGFAYGWDEARCMIEDYLKNGG